MKVILKLSLMVTVLVILFTCKNDSGSPTEPTRGHLLRIVNNNSPFILPNIRFISYNKTYSFGEVAVGFPTPYQEIEPGLYDVMSGVNTIGVEDFEITTSLEKWTYSVYGSDENFTITLDTSLTRDN